MQYVEHFFPDMLFAIQKNYIISDLNIKTENNKTCFRFLLLFVVFRNLLFTF
jgi:hypothetical protein